MFKISKPIDCINIGPVVVPPCAPVVPSREAGFLALIPVNLNLFQIFFRHWMPKCCALAAQKVAPRFDCWKQASEVVPYFEANF